MVTHKMNVSNCPDGGLEMQYVLNTKVGKVEKKFNKIICIRAMALIYKLIKRQL